ncbi:3-phosphoshikimate 1-carboxyvinyltransferase [Halodesulfovibrio sp.]|jgi:5-enolpyruvylshikimate-3-phosphate synthase/chorismate mutase|uniref:3-phosphoshikimate 1-carboxyvinyltransferase n=1 Tax=Halodesulfovibrio sp. TaxID=1912772 RepID=UPI0025F34F34|nr:3-phosphoshikimate 1-carboxyvinyltransferase [Halodesulfovibrio sp.]MCT4535457.1 3-phosphoshikimate 1-carboxyvinyltransferase [Halodesulfovibrio sp.]
MKKNMTLVEEISELDVELLKLLARRSKLLKKTRRRKKEGAGTDSISNEKRIRLAWEESATKFSRDPRLAHQMFTLLQDIEFISRDDAEDQNSFGLAPNTQPVNVDITGPAALCPTQIWIALAAANGVECNLTGISTAHPVSDLVKGFNQAGARLSWKGNDLFCKESKALDFADKVIFAGNSEFNVYLLALQAAASHGTLKLTGGSTLKDADLSAFRNFLPQLGARIAHVIPRSNGLPARLECSGIIPETVVVPENLSEEAVIAVLVAATTWKANVTIDLSQNAAATNALAIVDPIFESAGIEYSIEGTSCAISPEEPDFPVYPAITMDPTICASILAYPAFAGGKVALRGTWPLDTAEGDAVVALLKSVGLTIAIKPDSIVATKPERGHSTDAVDMQNLSSNYFPLAMALTCIKAAATKSPVELPAAPAGTSVEVIESFVAQANMLLEDNKVHPNADIPHAKIWTSPDAFWTMALGQLAFINRPLQLSNPGTITDLMPTFWMFYNTLPEPTMVRKPREEMSGDKPKRRRVFADNNSRGRSAD